MEQIVVSVFCLTYNHAEYIKDALEGFLRQKTTFKYNVFIYDDASTDGTSEIIREYVSQYPEIFQAYISEVNLHRSPERKKIMDKLYHQYLKGKYVAWCEGDDYWIDENKLQIQVDYLEKHSECSMTAHAALWKDYSKNVDSDYTPYEKSRILQPKEIILQSGGNLPTASLVMRRDVFIKDAQYPQCDVGDYPLQLYAINKGDIYYFNKIMSVYRYMHKGSWSNSMKKDAVSYIKHCYGMLHFMKQYDDYTNGRFHDSIKRRQLDYLYGSISPYIEMDARQYREICIQLRDDVFKGNGKYISNQCRIFEILKGTYKFCEEEQSRISKFKNILIMGNGEYARYLEVILHKNFVKYEGHIVTQIKESEQGTINLWDFKSCPYKPKETLIMIGIHQFHEEEICESLKKYGFENIYAPLWFDMKCE